MVTIIDGKQYRELSGKVYNQNDEVAVVYSPGYGVGLSTMISGVTPFFPPLVWAVLQYSTPESREMAQKRLEEKYPNKYFGGLENAVIEWMSKGTAFRIKEYDGYEKIEYIDFDGYVA